MIRCKYCQSYDLIRHGYNQYRKYKKQKYKCHSCSRIFSSPDKLPKSHFDSEIIGKCFDMYFRGFSYRVICRQIKEDYGIHVTHTSVYYWIQRYSELMDKSLSVLTPTLSSVWQMDETFIRFKGENSRQKKFSNGMWCWVCIDTKTRFVLDMFLSESKNQYDARRFFSRLKRRYNDVPRVIATDGNPSYRTYIREFYPTTEHLKIKSISVKPNTSFIERFNGTIKNRTKTMRCFEEFDPCNNTLTAFKIWYNFLRPHMALNGRTPAQEAGLTVDTSRRWLSLIRKSLVDNNYN